MIGKFKSVSAGFSVLAVLAAISSASQATKPQWSGKTIVVDGVATIQNPKKPLFGNVRFELTEELSLGSADDPNSNFFRIRDAEVDRAGNIYVADMSNFRVQKFDPNGKYVMTFGRSGQGPGEFLTFQGPAIRVSCEVAPCLSIIAARQYSDFPQASGDSILGRRRERKDISLCVRLWTIDIVNPDNFAEKPGSGGSSA